MVTNINLVSPESVNKSSLTGRSSFLLSIILIVIVASAYGVILYFTRSYTDQNKDLEKSIETEKKKLSGDNYTALFDFQDRLVMLDKIIADHTYWDVFLREFSRYVIPEVTLTKLHYNEKEGILEATGIATNYESLSRELMLLRDYPGTVSVDFKNSKEETANSKSPGGISLDVEIKLDKSVLKNN